MIFDPFTRGYIAAALTPKHEDGVFIGAFRWSDLAPETQGILVADSRAASHYRNSEEDGRLAWADRQNGSDPHFAPLGPLLIDTDGKVRFS